MKFNAKGLMALAVCGALSPLHSATAANVLNLSDELTAGGLTGSNTVSTPPFGASTYTNTFNGPTTPIPTAPSWGFYDDFVFTIGGSAVDSITSTINLGNSSAIDGLQVRLYNEAGNTPLPVTGVPTGSTLIDAWSTSLNIAPGMTGTVDVLPTTSLSAGTYVLEVRGNVTGSLGGGYSGTLNVSPVPLPAALPLMLSGMGLLGGAIRRRRVA